MGYHYLKLTRKENGSIGYSRCSEDEAEYIILPVTEYHGLKKAVRIVNDRALQQIDKSKADENGFRLLRADKKTYKRGDGGKLWLITKETPYSSKISLSEAGALIENRLREIYCWSDEIDLQDYAEGILNDNERVLRDNDITKACAQWHDKTHTERYEFLGENSNRGHALYRCWQDHSEMIVDITKVSVNYAQGLYEVSYWATELM